MYHRVGMLEGAHEARYAIAPEAFAAQMEALKRGGYQAVTVDALIAWLHGGPALPERALAITFDDGFRDVREHAMPVLHRLRWPFTVFLVSDFLGGEDAWTRNASSAARTRPLLGADEVQDMQRQGVSFQSHTCTHPSLPRLNDTDLAAQLRASKERLGQLLGHEVRYLAYPFGHHDDRVEAAARAAGYRAAFTTQPGFNRGDVNPYRVRRIDVYGTDTPAMLLRKVAFGTNDGSWSTAARYYLARMTSRMPRWAS
jgi:peptidoglycan/xylan/chitin deacetylase (PgdA/CDA1 family)